MIQIEMTCPECKGITMVEPKDAKAVLDLIGESDSLLCAECESKRPVVDTIPAVIRQLGLSCSIVIAPSEIKPEHTLADLRRLVFRRAYDAQQTMLELVEVSLEKERSGGQPGYKMAGRRCQAA